MIRQNRPPWTQDKICLRWNHLGVESDKRDTYDRTLDDHDDTCTTILATLCVSVMGVHTQTHKDKPSNSPELDHKYDKAINMPKDKH